MFDRATPKKEEKTKARGELIYHQHVDALVFGEGISLKTIADEMTNVAKANSRTTKPVCHVSLSFPPGESPNEEVLRDIVKDFASFFGYKDTGLIAFRHTDRKHEHIHIIANKIHASGRNTARSSFNYLDMGHFSRKMEHKYGLVPGKPMDALKIDGRGAAKATTYHETLRRHIDDLLPACPDLKSLQVLLLKKGYKSRVGNGITFIHSKTGTKIKGSDLGRDYSKDNLVKRINGTFLSTDKYSGGMGISKVSENLKNSTRASSNDLDSTSVPVPLLVSSEAKTSFGQGSDSTWEYELKKMLTSINASRVEADAAKGENHRKVNTSGELEGRGFEEKKEEKRRIARSSLPKRRQQK
ncbi:relaxase/mobilization nuclease domain-containing protein [Telluribacter sp.]|jgi:hypothetical protein|uniref:relaxase/mobilization nuclease domain-containing protein n=1 Tax=Telluribacter sp. TaxID=1978767 RepID=UPI002E11D2C2|nr:relaxase/mobilization nuclease domain-containing protein [Telluribacter sp.]